MKTSKMKCPKCGYIFDGDTNCTNDTCPLCSNEYSVSEALRLFEKYDKNQPDTKPEEKSKNKIIIEWAVFFGSFTAFIFILYVLIEFLLGK